MSYLEYLSLRLALGAMRLPEAVRHQHAAYLAALQREDGGFAGRQGASDLYYTSFALRGLALLGELNQKTAERAARFLQYRLDAPPTSVDFYSLIGSAVLLELVAGLDLFATAGRDRQAVVRDYLARLWRDEGGYAKTDSSPHTSTYHTFLAITCQQLVGLEPTNAEQTVRLIASRRRDDGGFVELAPLGQSGTNPTAAAIGLLRMLGALEESIQPSAAGFLAQMQTTEGGLRANSRIPVADLLSTFTGLVALADLNALSTIDLAALQRYATSLQSPTGGFRAGVWDDEADVEYTFYGLGVMSGAW